MTQCKQCGATFTENTAVCPQCGTHVSDGKTSIPQPAQKDLDFLRPGITGGLALGVLSSLPVINFANCLCCLWVQGGGALATWLLNKQRPGGLKYGDGALGGVLSGLTGAVVATIIGIPVRMLMMTPAMVERMMALVDQFMPNAPPQVREQIQQGMSSGLDVAQILIGLVANMILFGLFAMVGGILTVAVLNRKKTD